MTDIYSQLSPLMSGMQTVYKHLKKNCFIAQKELPFEIALKR